jgi:cyanate permease
MMVVQSLQAIWLVGLYGILLGTTFGLMYIINSVSWAKYYGRRHLGSITGLTTTFVIIGSALGPMPFGIGRDQLGSYDAVLSIFAILPLFLAILTLFTGRPNKDV